MGPFSKFEAFLVRLGIFLLFLVTFGDYVARKIWAVIGPLFLQSP
jgi:hypothetical protein